MWKCGKCETNNQDTDERCAICNSVKYEIPKSIPVKLIIDETQQKVEMETLEHYVTTNLYKSEKPEKLEIYNDEDIIFNYQPVTSKKERILTLIKSPATIIVTILLVILILQFI